MKFRLLRVVLIAALLCAGMVVPAGGSPLSQSGGDNPVYIPVISNRNNPLLGKMIINAPYFDVADVRSQAFASMGVFWFGKLNSNSNYSDVRIGYNNTALYVHVATVDKWLWYNQNPANSGIDTWDSVTLLINLDSGTSINKPGPQSYRFLSQVSPRSDTVDYNYQAAFRGNGTQWEQQQSNIFQARSGWRGAGFNDLTIDHGWTMTFVIPFSNLGLSQRPTNGSLWKMALLTHDRDSQNGAMLPDQRWPEDNSRDDPSTWGLIRFGIPVFTPPSVSNLHTTTIYQGLNGAVVPDTAAGGGFHCGEYYGDVWSQWGDGTISGYDQVPFYINPKFNIQNQSDISEWPCFSKYFATFPLDQIPPGKIIRSATLVLHQFGGSGDPCAVNDTNPRCQEYSRIQVLRLGRSWDEATLTWNNAPHVLENDRFTRVYIYKGTFVWPGDPYEWNVSRFASQAYDEGVPLRLALYSGDVPQHTGKYFFSSNADESNPPSGVRPTLIVEWGDP